MNNMWLVAAIGVLFLLVPGESYRFSRPQGLLDNFHEYDTIDSNNNLNLNGVTVPMSFSVFGNSYGAVKVYDTGYISLNPSLARVDVETMNANPVLVQYPYIAPNWIPDWTGYAYTMAYRVVNTNTFHLLHDLDRINVEVNRALNQYPETWTCHSALIVTWKTSLVSDPTKYDKYQAVLASGSDATGNKNYGLFLYETLDIPSNEYPFAFVNGYYTTQSQAKLAGVCSSAGDFQYLKTFSNFKCGNNGIFLLNMAAGAHCNSAEINQCVSGTSTKQNCMRPTNEPFDTCTESYYCQLNQNLNRIEFTLNLRYYQYSKLSGLNYLAFIGSGTDAVPGEDGVLQYISNANCLANTNTLANAGTSSAKDSRSFVTPIINGLGNCGVQVDLTAQTVKFAFAVYDPNEPDVVKDGNLVVYGICHLDEMPMGISQTVMFNDNEPPTSVPNRVRTVTMSWLDGNSNVIDSAELGDLVYAQICYDPGDFFNLNADPFGVHALNCFMANNEAMNNEALPGTDRSISVIEQGCVVLPSDRAFHFDKTFRVVPPGTKGQEWCIKTGWMEAAKFEVVGGSDNIWLQCTYSFCTQPDETLCDNSCSTAGGGRGSRSVKANTDALGVESLKVSLNVKDNSSDGRNGITEEATCADDHVDKVTVIATVTILVAIIIIISIFAVIMLKRLLRQKG